MEPGEKVCAFFSLPLAARIDVDSEKRSVEQKLRKVEETEEYVACIALVSCFIFPSFGFCFASDQTSATSLRPAIEFGLAKVIYLIKINYC